MHIHQAATADAKRRGHSRVGTEDLLYALFNNTKTDSRARYWLGKQAQTRSVDMYPDDVLAESQEESSTRPVVNPNSFYCVVGHFSVCLKNPKNPDGDLYFFKGMKSFIAFPSLLFPLLFYAR